MPRPLAPLHNIKRARLHLSRPLDHQLRHRGREPRAVLRADQVRGRDVHPGCVRGGAEEDACAVGAEGGGEGGGQGGGEVVVEDCGGVGGGDAYCVGLGKGG